MRDLERHELIRDVLIELLEEHALTMRDSFGGDYRAFDRAAGLDVAIKALRVRDESAFEAALDATAAAREGMRCVSK